MHIYVFSKTPSSVLDYTVDWEEWLVTDTIASSTWVADIGIIIVASSFTITTATIWVSGGTVGSNYNLTNTVVTAGGRTEIRVVTLLVRELSNVRYLIPDLRLHLGDLDPTSYRYMDDWLEASLIMSIKSLGRWWRYKYLLDDSNLVYRNPYFPFAMSEPPIIDVMDERIIILMSSIIIKGGTLENNAWNVGSWRDAEIAYSNIESSRSRTESLKRDVDELKNLIQPPSKRLARTQKGDLPGYLNNDYEIGSLK